MLTSKQSSVDADITNYRRQMRTVRNDLGLLSDSMDGMARMGRTLTFALTGPLVALGTAAAKTSIDFDSAMRNVSAIARLTEAEFQSLKNEVIDFNSTVRSTPVDAVNSLYTVVQSGVTDVAAAMNIMETAVKTAEATSSTLDPTVRAMTATMLSYGYIAADTARQQELLNEASGTFVKLIQLGVGSPEAFANSMGHILPTANLLNISMTELGGSWAFLTQRGIPASRAATSLNNALSRMIKPSETMREAFQRLGVDGAENLIDKFGGLRGALNALLEDVGSAEALGEMFGDIRGFRAMATIFKNLDDYNRVLDQFEDNIDGVLDQAWAEQMKSTAAQLDLLKSATVGLGIVIGDLILKYITPIVVHLTNFINRVRVLNPALLEMSVLFGMIAAATGPVLWYLGTLLSPINMLIGIIGLLAAAWSNNWGNIRQKVEEAVTAIVGDLAIITDTIDIFWETLTGEKLFSVDIDTDVNVDTSGIEGVAGIIDAELNTQTGTPFTADFETYATLSHVWFEHPEREKLHEAFGSMNEFVAAALTAMGIDDPTMIPGYYTLDMMLGGKGPQTKADMVGLLSEDIINILPEELDLQAEYMALRLPTPEIEDSFVTRVRTAFGAAWANLKPHLGTFADNFKTYVRTTVVPEMDSGFADIIGGIDSGINRLLGVFDPQYEWDGTPLMRGLREVTFSERFTESINSLAADAGEAVASFEETLEESFPKTITAANTLINTIESQLIPDILTGIQSGVSLIGGWLVNTGISSLSKSAGHFAGTLAVMLVEGLKALPSLLLQGAAGIPAALSYLGTDVMRPFMDGFSGAVGDSELEGIFDMFFVTLAGILVVGAGAKFMAAIIAAGFVKVFSATILAATSKGVMAAGAGLLARGVAAAGGAGAWAMLSRGFGSLAAGARTIAGAKLGGIGLGIVIYKAFEDEIIGARNDVYAFFGVEGDKWDRGMENFLQMLVDSALKVTRGIQRIIGGLNNDVIKLQESLDNANELIMNPFRGDFDVSDSDPWGTQPVPSETPWDQGMWDGSLPGNQMGTPWTGFGGLSTAAGIVHNREAVIPAHGMRIMPSPSGLKMEGGGSGGGRQIVIQEAHFHGVQDIPAFYDAIQKEGRKRGAWR